MSKPEPEAPCEHGKDRSVEWCEPCFRNEQRKKYPDSSLYAGYCDFLGRGHG